MNLASRLLGRLDKIEEATSYVPEVKDTLDTIGLFCKRETDTPNSWEIGNRVFFFEWPTFGETEDGSVDGVVYEKIGNTSRNVGEYSISGDGKVINFPFLPKTVVDKVNGS